MSRLRELKGFVNPGRELDIRRVTLIAHDSAGIDPFGAFFACRERHQIGRSQRRICMRWQNMSMAFPGRSFAPSAELTEFVTRPTQKVPLRFDLVLAIVIAR